MWTYFTISQIRSMPYLFCIPTLSLFLALYLSLSLSQSSLFLFKLQLNLICMHNWLTNMWVEFDKFHIEMLCIKCNSAQYWRWCVFFQCFSIYLFFPHSDSGIAVWMSEILFILLYLVEMERCFIHKTIDNQTLFKRSEVTLVCSVSNIIHQKNKFKRVKCILTIEWVINVMKWSQSPNTIWFSKYKWM